MNSNPIDGYAAELTEILDFRDVPEPAAADIVRGLRRHAEESGRDPRDEFGSPRDFAQNIAPKSGLIRFWALIVTAVALTVVSTEILISGIFGVIAPAVTLWGLSPWLRVGLGAMGLAAFVLVVVAVGAASRRKRQLRSWKIRP